MANQQLERAVPIQIGRHGAGAEHRRLKRRAGRDLAPLVGRPAEQPVGFAQAVEEELFESVVVEIPNHSRAHAPGPREGRRTAVAPLDPRKQRHEAPIGGLPTGEYDPGTPQPGVE